MDEYTRQHFERWLARTERDDTRDMVRRAMMVTFLTDTEYWSQAGWPRLYEAAGCPELMGRVQD